MAKNIVTLNLDNTDYSIRPFGICSSASTSQAKTVSISEFVLCSGATALIKFENGNAAPYPTLNINNTGAKPIIGGVLSSGEVYEFVYDGTSWNVIKSDSSKTYHVMDLTSLSTDTFYPIIFHAKHYVNDCEIHSPNVSGTHAYNQNIIHFQLHSCGYSDTPKSFKVLSYGTYSATEITIGAIGYGNTAGEHCVWLRGGLKYEVLCNIKPVLYSEGYSYLENTFMPGVEYSGGTNEKVTICWSASNPANEILSTEAKTDKLGGLKIGYTQSGQNYPVQLDSNKRAYVNVPWSDTTNADTLDGHDSTYFATKTEQDNLANQILALASGLSLTVSVSPTIIYKNEATSVSVTATTKDSAGNVTASEIKILDGSTELKKATNTYTTNVSKSITTTNNTYTFKATAVVNGMTLNKSISVNARYPIYYGMGTSATEVKTSGTKLAATSAIRTYNATAGSNGVRFYLLVPSNDVTKPVKFSMGGAPVNMVSSTETLGGISYNVYYTNAVYNKDVALTIEAKSS